MELTFEVRRGSQKRRVTVSSHTFCIGSSDDCECHIGLAGIESRHLRAKYDAGFFYVCLDSPSAKAMVGDFQLEQGKWRQVPKYGTITIGQVSIRFQGPKVEDPSLGSVEDRSLGSKVASLLLRISGPLLVSLGLAWVYFDGILAVALGCTMASCALGMSLKEGSLFYGLGGLFAFTGYLDAALVFEIDIWDCIGAVYFLATGQGTLMHALIVIGGGSGLSLFIFAHSVFWSWVDRPE